MAEEDTMWVNFPDGYRWVVSVRSNVQYKPGDHCVPRRCGEAAIKEGKAVEIPAKPRVYVEDKPPVATPAPAVVKSAAPQVSNAQPNLIQPKPT